jgi:hypothetical protein
MQIDELHGTGKSGDLVSDAELDVRPSPSPLFHNGRVMLQASVELDHLGHLP